MAARKKQQRKTAKKRRANIKGAPPAAPPPAPIRPTPATPPGRFLDLTAVADRPTIRLPAGDYKMRLSEELTFEEWSRHVAIGKQLINQGGDVDAEGVLDELQALIVEASGIIIVDLDDAAAASITPGMFLKISAFFRELADVSGATSSERGSNGAPAANDSSETSAAA